MRIIPGNTKVRIELFKGISLTDMVVGGIAALVAVLIVGSSLPFKWIIGIVHIAIWGLLLVRIDSEPNYVFVLHILKHFWFPRKYERTYSDEDLKDIAKEGFDVFVGSRDTESAEKTAAELIIPGRKCMTAMSWSSKMPKTSARKPSRAFPMRRGTSATWDAATPSP